MNKTTVLAFLLFTTLWFQYSCSSQNSNPTQPGNGVQPTDTPQIISTPGASPSSTAAVPSPTPTATHAPATPPTPTPTPFCTHNGTAGDSNNNTTSLGIHMTAAQFSLGQTSAISDIRFVYVPNDYGTQIVLGFYSNAYNSNLGTTGPDSLIVQIPGTFTLGANSQQQFNFAPVTLTAGTYWVAAMATNYTYFAVSSDTVLVSSGIVAYELTLGAPSASALPGTYSQMNKTNLIPNFLVDYCY
jgi:hypothetical protein